MIAMKLLFLAIAIPAGALLGELGEQGSTTEKLGTISVGDYEGIVLFQDPADDGKSYRVSLAIPKPWEDPQIKTERIEIWLLAKGGRAMPVTQRPEGEVLIEAGSRGATANAIYFFERQVDASELAAVVVTVDGKPKAFQLKASDDR